MDGSKPLGVKEEGVGVKWGGTDHATSDDSKWTAQSDDRWKVVGVLKMKMSVTQDGLNGRPREGMEGFGGEKGEDDGKHS